MNEVEWITDLDIPIFGLTGTFPLNLDAELAELTIETTVDNHQKGREDALVGGMC